MQKVNEKTGIEMLYRSMDIDTVPFENTVADQFNVFCNELELHTLQSEPNWRTKFNIPQHYKEIDIEEYVKRLIPIAGGLEEEGGNLARVEQELGLYKARNLFPILQLMIYIVDTMRKNNLVWGVGRGSCVASYVLFLLGVHKINSIKYNLDIKEFLKED